MAPRGRRIPSGILEVGQAKKTEVRETIEQFKLELLMGWHRLTTSVSGLSRLGKLVIHGARGFISSVDVYCRNIYTDPVLFPLPPFGEDAALILGFAPYVGGELDFSVPIYLPFPSFEGWRSVDVRRSWNHDSLFLYSTDDAGGWTGDKVEIAYDEHTPYDSYQSANTGDSWVANNRRYGIRIHIQGEPTKPLLTQGFMDINQISSQAMYKAPPYFREIGVDYEKKPLERSSIDTTDKNYFQYWHTNVGGTLTSFIHWIEISNGTQIVHYFSLNPFIGSSTANAVGEYYPVPSSDYGLHLKACAVTNGSYADIQVSLLYADYTSIEKTIHLTSGLSYSGSAQDFIIPVNSKPLEQLYLTNNGPDKIWLFKLSMLELPQGGLNVKPSPLRLVELNGTGILSYALPPALDYIGSFWDTKDAELFLLRCGPMALDNLTVIVEDSVDLNTWRTVQSIAYTNNSIVRRAFVATAPYMRVHMTHADPSAYIAAGGHWELVTGVM